MEGRLGREVRNGRIGRSVKGLVTVGIVVC